MQDSLLGEATDVQQHIHSGTVRKCQHHINRIHYINPRTCVIFNRLRRPIARESTTAHVHLLHGAERGDVEVEDIHREAERRARVGDLIHYQLGAILRVAQKSKTYIDEPSNMALDGSAAQEQVDLIVAVACYPQSARSHFSERRTSMAYRNVADTR